MSKYRDVDNLEKEINDKFDKFTNELVKIANEKTSKAMDEAYREFGIYQQRKINQLFKDAVGAFYESYTPNLYQRTYGLYDVLDMKLDEKGIVDIRDDTYMSLINPNKLHKDRNGNSLFDKVFMEGYHGGAESISGAKSNIWGLHPSQGTPHYRAAGWVKYPGESKKKWHKYGKWGRRAVKSFSPYETFSKDLESAEGGEIFNRFKEISERYNKNAVDQIQSVEVPRLYAKIFK